MAELLTTFLFGSIVFILIFYIMQRGNRKPVNYPRGPRGIPFFGNILDMKKSDAYGPAILKTWAKEYGAVYSMRLGSYDAVVLNTPQVIREAFSNVNGIGRLSNVFFFDKITGIRGIVQNEGEVWKTTRRFALRSLRDFGMGKKSLEDRIQEEAQAMVQAMAKQGEKAFNPTMMLNNVASNIICSIVFGDRYDYEDKDFQQLSKYLNHLFKTGGLSNPEIFMPSMLALSPIINFGFTKTVRLIFKLRDFVKERINKHREVFDPNQINSFIDIYLKAEHDGEFSNKAVEENLMTSIFDLFIAGSETSATTLRWSLLYFINYPEVQAKCQQEIKNVIGQVRLPVNADRAKMPYMEATIYEIQRRANIVGYGVLHRVTETMEVSGYTLPTDTILLSNLHCIHMDEKYWGDPEVFRPERWLDDKGSFFKHEPYMPFSTGPRECPGKSLALQEIFIFLVSLLQKFSFRAKDPKNPPPIEGVMGATYSPNMYETVIEKL